MNANCEINYLCIALAMLSLLSHLSVKTGTTFVTFPLGLYPEDREMHSVVHCCANLASLSTVSIIWVQLGPEPT